MPRYKHGKQTTPIDFTTFDNAMKHGEFKSHTHKSFLAFLYWFGVRISEALERVKEDFTVEDNILSVNAPAKKRGERPPLEIDVDLPHVNLIIERLNKTKPKKRLWNFTSRTGERIVKRAMGDKYYPHFFRLNRSVHFLDDPTTTMPQMMGWFGWKSTRTLDSYVGYSKRHIESQRKRLRKEVETR